MSALRSPEEVARELMRLAEKECVSDAVLAAAIRADRLEVLDVLTDRLAHEGPSSKVVRDLRREIGGDDGK